MNKSLMIHQHAPKFQTFELEGDFDWNAQEQGLVLGGFSYGYVLTQLLGGFLADRYGGKWVYGLCTGASGALGILLPFAAPGGIALVAVLRAVQGALQGCSIPALYSIVARWIPKQEKGKLFSLMFAGRFYQRGLKTMTYRSNVLQACILASFLVCH